MEMLELNIQICTFLAIRWEGGSENGFKGTFKTERRFITEPWGPPVFKDGKDRDAPGPADLLENKGDFQIYIAYQRLRSTELFVSFQ